MSNTLRRIANTFFIIAHFPVLLGAAVLEYFFETKMGVYRYLVYKNRVFEASVFSTDKVQGYQYLLMAGIAVGLILLLWHFLKAGKREMKRQAALFLLVNAIGYYFISFVSPGQLAAYYFFLLGIFVVILLRFFKLIMTSFNICE